MGLLETLSEIFLKWTDDIKVWLEVNPISANNMRELLRLYKNSGNIFDSDLLDEFLSQQPNILCLLTLLLMLAAFLFLCFTFSCLTKPIVQKRKHTEHFQYPPKKTCLLTFQLILYSSLWLLLVGCTLLLTCLTTQLNSRYHKIEKELEATNELLFHNENSSEKYVIIAMDTISIHEKDRLKKFDELGQLSKFTALRELGYEFKPIESDFAHRFEMLFFTSVVLIYAACLLISVFSLLWGCYKFVIDIYPNEKQNSAKVVEYLLVRMANLCYFMAPFVIFASAITLLYMHLHDTICPILQLEIQNQNMEDYVNLYHGYFDSNNLISFFNDLLEERIPLNLETCTNFMRPMQGLSLILSVISLASLPWAFITIKLAKTLRRNRKSAFYSSETYSTIPEKSKPPSVHSMFMPKY